MKLNIRKVGKLVAASLAVAGLFSNEAFAASANGTAKQIVVAAIAITNVSDLDFGTAPQGDAAKTVAPGSSENADNGSFNVTGQANTAYTISLPANVTMITGGGGANETILVNAFVSSPAAGANGLLNGSGAQTIFIGATRAALGAAQVPGTYTATYAVTVVY